MKRSMRQHLHAVAKGIRNGVQDIGGAHEEDLGQVDGNIQVVVQEAGILLRVQQLQQRARRVALVACTAIGILACMLIHTLPPTTIVHAVDSTAFFPSYYRAEGRCIPYQ